MNFLYEDDYFFAIDKPAGHFVHPPEKSRYPVAREKICLYTLRDYFQQGVFPAHRLDAPTTGVVLFAKKREYTRELNFLFAERQIQKTYLAVTRGHVDARGTIDIPLEIAGFEALQESTTQYKKLADIELPYAVGKKYATSRYSLVEVNPLTGRWHQIRRHFDRIAHPLIGDIEHGDSHHNRFFRDDLKIHGLCLRAQMLQFVHPWTQQKLRIEAASTEQWNKIEQLFGLSNQKKGRPKSPF